MPKRASLPSILPPRRHRRPWPGGSDCRRLRRHRRSTAPAVNRIIIAARIAQPCFVLPTALPNVQVSPAPSAKIDSIWMKLERSPGFSNGWAALALKKPPPLVPSILIAICDATGPSAIVCCAPSIVVAVTEPASVCGMPSEDQDQRIDDAGGQQDVERDPGQIGPEIAERRRSRAARSRGSARRRWRCRSRPRRNCGPRARPSGSRFDMVVSPP